MTATKTGKRGGQRGNKNASHDKPWTAALRRALARYGKGDLRHGLDKIADRVVSMAADEGELDAILEIAVRLEGKPVQPISGEDGGAVIVEIVRFAPAPAPAG